MFRLALENDLLDKVAGAVNRVDRPGRKRRSLGQAANRFQKLFSHLLLIGGDLLGRLSLLVIHLPTFGCPIDLPQQIAPHHLLWHAAPAIPRRTSLE
jgi:hypothetical protein